MRYAKNRKSVFSYGSYPIIGSQSKPNKSFAKSVGRIVVRASIDEFIKYSADSLLFPGAGQLAIQIAPVGSLVDSILPE